MRDLKGDVRTVMEGDWIFIGKDRVGLSEGHSNQTRGTVLAFLTTSYIYK